MLVVLTLVWIAGYIEVSCLSFNPCDDIPLLESGKIVEDFNVTTFIDENRNVRLNISWDQRAESVKDVDIIIDHSDNGYCFPFDGAINYSLDKHCLIEPDMTMEHPALRVKHGCVYNVTLKVSNVMCTIEQRTSYQVPECVKYVCDCRDEYNYAPYKISKIIATSNGVHEVTFKEHINYYLSLHDVLYEMTYRRKNTNGSETTIYSNLNENSTTVRVTMNDLQPEATYTVEARFIIDGCYYSSSIDLTVPPEKFNMVIKWMLICGMFSLSICLLFYVLHTHFSKILMKIGKYLPCLRQMKEHSIGFALEPFTRMQEEVNAQYTPLEFILQAHKFDRYEFPRNKIILKKEIGKGAFGVVYFAKAFELGEPGYTMVAAKLLRENAPEEETLDFQGEIDILKRIDKHGGHRNIVRLLACVTMEKPLIMVMELVPCGALKEYLINLREKWKDGMCITKQHFFPDDMEEDWLKPKSTLCDIKEGNEYSLKYTTCMFEDNSDGAYIVPTHPELDMTSTIPGCPSVLNSSPSPRRPRIIIRKSSDGGFKHIKVGGSPTTPVSITSSGLPSITETVSTTLDMEHGENETPLLDEITRPPEPALDHTELQQFAFQIASGMEYLEKISITHRDLAARNILITNDKVLKISDFGMSRNGPYINKKTKKLPLRWMAIEAIEELKCDSKSDVWSFGVVLWEIGTLGAFPYDHTPDTLVLHNLKIGKRLERPKICTDELYSLMLRCWSAKPEERPCFKELVEMLDINKRKVYVDFSNLSPKYVFPPTSEENDGSSQENKTSFHDLEIVDDTSMLSCNLP